MNNKIPLAFVLIIVLLPSVYAFTYNDVIDGFQSFLGTYSNFITGKTVHENGVSRTSVGTFTSPRGTEGGRTVTPIGGGGISTTTGVGNDDFDCFHTISLSLG